MPSQYFDKSPEESRRTVVKTARDIVLGKKEARRLDPQDNLPLVSENNETNWFQTPQVLANPFTYSRVQKSMIADIAGLLSGGEVLADAANRLAQTQEQELAALEKAVAAIEGDISVSESLREASLIGPEVWYPGWTESRDTDYRTNEPGLSEDNNPLPALVNQPTGFLTLPYLSRQQLYGQQQSGRLRVLQTSGGDLTVGGNEQLGEFGYYPVKIHSKSKVGPTKSLVPWIHPEQNGPAIRVRIDLDTPGVFTRVSVCAGERYLAKPGNFYWYPFGNEGLENILPDQYFTETLTQTGNQWTLVNAGSFVINAADSTGPDASQRLAGEVPGNSPALLVLSTGKSEFASQNEFYSLPVAAYQEFTPPGGGGPLRLAIRWRGLGRHIAGKNSFVTVQFYGDTNGDNSSNDLQKLVYEEHFSLADGLARQSTPPAGEFSLSRFLVHCPQSALQSRVILTTTRPEGFTDMLETSVIEIAQVSIDGFAGSVYDWREPVAGQPGEYPSYVTTLPFQPEAAFFELSLSQTAYQKSPDEDGFYGREYDISLRDILIEGIEYSRTGRWISKPKRFIGEPRRFQLVVPSGTENLGNVEFRISLRPGERSFAIDTSLPLQIVSNEEASPSFNSNTIVYNVHEEVETFDTGTDLSGQTRLRFYPYVNKERVYTLSSLLTANARRIEYDPNAVNPLVYLNT